MTQPMIVNFINFIRAVEPRVPVDLERPVAEQIRLHQRYQIPATWLLQYDALTSGSYVEMLKTLDKTHEIGIWMEIVQPLVEKAGLTWRGRYPWDWHSHVGFSIGYSPTEREKILDVFMEDFKQAFGYYPASMGSWLFDAHSLAYLHDRYGLVGACNCKDQHGTDGYTLWGGYWNQAYYPSRSNAFMPAQTADGQIPVPIFRMLGSDPIYQYDCGMVFNPDCSEAEAQGVVTLEPVYLGGGGNPVWVKWFFKNLQQNPSLSFQYAQAGQENSMGWKQIEKGYADQIAWLAEQRRSETPIRLETLGTTARWFRDAYPLTPASSISAIGDSEGNDRSSVWYNCRRYRLNLSWHDQIFRIRDIHLFDERYSERYLETACLTQASTYDTLPVVEGFLWSGGGCISGLRLYKTDGTELVALTPHVEETGNGELTVHWCNSDGSSFRIICCEDFFRCEADSSDWELTMSWASSAVVPFQSVDENILYCVHEGHAYMFRCKRGTLMFDNAQRMLTIRPDAGCIELEPLRA